MQGKPYEQKIISFEAEHTSMLQIQKEIDAGWKIVNLVSHANSFVAVLEQDDKCDRVFFPKKKKIRIK